MEQRVVKLGVVGLNRGKDVVSEILGDSNVVLYAICDKNAQLLEERKAYFEKEHGVENLLCFDSLEAFLASDVEAVYIATDATLHAKQVVQALDAGKHVISEIPTVNTIEEARMLKAAAKAHPGQKFMVAENCCFWAFIETWKKMYEDGKLGQAVYAEAEYLHADDVINKEPDPIQGEWRKTFDAIKYITHDLGPLLYIMNDRCVSVSCFEPDVRYHPLKNGSENGVAIFKTEKGAVIRILICFGAYVGFDHNFAIMGTRGTVETDKTKPLETAHTFAKLSEIPGTFEKKMEIPVGLSYDTEGISGHGGADAKMMRAFVKCILEDTEPPVNIDMGIQMSIPGILAHESALNGGMPVEIPVID